MKDNEARENIQQLFMLIRDLRRDLDDAEVRVQNRFDRQVLLNHNRELSKEKDKLREELIDLRTK